MGDGEIILDRINVIKSAQSPGNLAGHAPVGVPAGGQSQIAADPLDMGIHRDHQLRRGDTVPDTQIDPVRRTHHPAQIHTETLAGTA